MRECCELVGNLCRFIPSWDSWSPKMGFHPFPTCLAAVPIEWCRFRKEKLCWGGFPGRDLGWALLPVPFSFCGLVRMDFFSTKNVLNPCFLLTRRQQQSQNLQGSESGEWGGPG